MSTPSTSDERVVLVNTYDEPIGHMNKHQAHVEGELHRAFSIFVFNDDGEFLLQRRALDKYHSGGLWSNTCCSHPRPGEKVIDGANRRLEEEMGFACDLDPAFAFVYQAALENDLIEYEFDHVLVGYSKALPTINKTEVEEYRYASADEIRKELELADDTFTVWFRLCFERLTGFVKDRTSHRAAA